MNIKNIPWNKVTRFSQLIAIVLFVGVFALGFFLGKTYEYHAFVNSFNTVSSASSGAMEKPIADVTYTCDAQKTIRAVYRKEEVNLFLSDGRQLSLPQVISGSGARYANADESFVFWNKGNTAFITEGLKQNQSTTFANCATKPTSS